MDQLTKISALLGLLSLATMAGASAAADTLPENGLPPGWVPQVVEIEAGATRKILTTDSANGFRRSFRLHVPAGYDPSKSYPLVVALHGAMATARIFEDQSGLSAAADRYGFFVVYPNGMGLFSLLRHWNGGYCCGRAQKTSLDDPGYLDRVRSWVTDTYPIDLERVYLVGYSNGGMLAYWYAATRASELAGLGIWASSIAESPPGAETPSSWQMPWPNPPLPAFVAHGLDDPRLPFERPQELAEPPGKPSPRDALLGALGSARAWARANGCSEEESPVTSELNGDVRVDTWCGQDQRRVVELQGIAGWGHDWPGPKRTDKLDPAHPMYQFDLAEEMWRFFENLRR